MRKIGEKLREYKEPLGKIISLEMGKIYAEGLGEVQEAIDICDFAVGLSRSLNGSVIPSERPGHIMLERYKYTIQLRVFSVNIVLVLSRVMWELFLRSISPSRCTSGT